MNDDKLSFEEKSLDNIEDVNSNNVNEDNKNNEYISSIDLDE